MSYSCIHTPAVGFCCLLEDVTNLCGLEEVNFTCLTFNCVISLLFGLKMIYLCHFYRLSNTVFLATHVNRSLDSSLSCFNFHAMYLLILNASFLNELASCLFFFFCIFYCQLNLLFPLSLLLLLHLYDKFRLSPSHCYMALCTLFVALHLVDATLDLNHHFSLLVYFILDAYHLSEDLVLN